MSNEAPQAGTRPGLCLVLLVTSGLLALLPTARAGDEPAKTGSTFSLYMENDLFAGTDRQYTSGIKAGWSSPDLEDLQDSRYARPFLPLFALLPQINEKVYQKNLLFAIGQNVYTPDDTVSAEPIERDRPYAGWLYLGLGVVWKNSQVRNSLAVNIGVVGPWSFAEESQGLVHDLRGMDRANGWDNQLHNELGIVVTYLHDWRLPRQARRVGLDWELLPHAGIAVGNVLTAANLGGEIHAGWNLPDDFGTAAIGPAETTSTPVEGTQGAGRSRVDVGLYLFARIDGRAVAHDIFLDGNTFGSGPSVDRNVFVADMSFGLAINARNTKIAYAFVCRTREFRHQKENQIFGTVSLNLSF